jgi:hypothetical protein
MGFNIGFGRNKRETYPSGQGGGASALPLARVATDGLSGAITDEANTPAGLIVFAARIVAQKTGVLLVSGTFDIGTSAADIASVTVTVVDPLTAITGGTPVAEAIVSPPSGALIANPTSTTPTDVGAPVIATGGFETFSDGGAQVVAVPFSGTILVPVGTAVGIVARGRSANSTTWTVGGSYSVIEV